MGKNKDVLTAQKKLMDCTLRLPTKRPASMAYKRKELVTIVSIKAKFN